MVVPRAPGARGPVMPTFAPSQSIQGEFVSVVGLYVN